MVTLDKLARVSRTVDECFCRKCGGYIWSSEPHRCPPIWECRFDNQWKEDGDWREVHAISDQDAAEKFAERHDCENEYGILQQGERCEEVIEVRRDGKVTRFRITAESVPTYRAEELGERG